MIYIGIDPGASGGIAWVNELGNAYNAMKMPETERDLIELLRSVKGEHVPSIGGPFECRAVLERVWSSPQMGVASAFKFGTNVGTLRMALVAAGIPFEEVTPQKWQKAMGCQVGKSRAAGGEVGGNKNITKRRAQALFPGHLKVTHAIADALLIAEFCRRMHGAQGLTEAPRGLFDGKESRTAEGLEDEEGEDREGAAQAAAEVAAGNGRPRHRGDRARRARLR